MTAAQSNDCNANHHDPPPKLCQLLLPCSMEPERQPYATSFHPSPHLPATGHPSNNKTTTDHTPIRDDQLTMTQPSSNNDLNPTTNATSSLSIASPPPCYDTQKLLNNICQMCKSFIIPNPFPHSHNKIMKKTMTTMIANICPALSPQHTLAPSCDCT